MRKHIITVFIAAVIFIALCVKLIDFTAILDPTDTTARDIVEKEHKKKTVEGSFLDSRGKVIFDPQNTYDADDSYLPVPYSYILGYNLPNYGSSGLRNTFSSHLYNDLGTGKGGSIQLTIDDVLQTRAYTALAEKNLEGSVIVMNARNGEILAMAGRRAVDFNLNGITSEKWSKYNQIDGMFLSPSTGNYKAPGSVFKVLTSASAIINGLEDYVYTDTGSLEVNGYPIYNAGKAIYGEQDLQSALISSTNTYFGSLSLELGERAMGEIFNSFLVGERIDLGFAVLNSAAKLNGSDLNLAQVGFGQGGVAVSPLHIAMIGQSIVNNGRMIKPTLIKSMTDASGKNIFQNTEHELLARTLKSDVSDKVKALMRGVTENKHPEWLEYTENVYSKTGTAESDDKASIYTAYYLCMTDEYVILVSVNDTDKFGGNFGYVIEGFLKELY